MAILFPLFGVFTSFILIYYLSALNRSNIFLALFFLCCNLVVLVYYGLHYTKNQFWEGVCFVHWLPLSFLLGPLLFYYTKYTLSDSYKLSKWDWLHLIPAMIVLINCLPFTTLPFEKKAAIAHEIINVTEKYVLDFQFFSFKSILISRNIHLIIYCLLSLFYFQKSTKDTAKANKKYHSNYSTMKRWIYLLSFIQLVIATNSVLHMLTVFNIHFSFESKKYTEIFSAKDYYFGISGAGFFIQNIFLFLFPKILYGNISYVREKKGNNIIDEIKLSIPKNIPKTKDFDNVIQLYLLEKPFVQKGFNLSQMSFDLKISERLVSNYLNNNLNTSFSDWRKALRIAHVCQLIEEGKFQSLTIEAIASDAGFVSRSKFNEAFKEIKGVTPTDYIKSLINKKGL